MTDALGRTEPRIDRPEELERLVADIVREVRPVAIYLFGSRARGDAQEDSDYDLMIVVADDAVLDRSFYDALWQIAGRQRMSATPLVSRRKNFAWRRREIGTLEFEVESDGLQLYPKPGRAFPLLTTGPPRMNVNVVEEWLRRVERDIGVALLCCNADDPMPDQAAYHIQQAAEKLVKGALVALQIRPRKGHEIQEFASLLPEDFPLKKRFHRLERFSKFAWAFRHPEYPGQEPIPEPSVDEARRWLEEVRPLKRDFARWLEKTAGS